MKGESSACLASESDALHRFDELDKLMKLMVAIRPKFFLSYEFQGGRAAALSGMDHGYAHGNDYSRNYPICLEQRRYKWTRHCGSFPLQSWEEPKIHASGRKQVHLPAGQDEG
jgi:hypothetical protein